MKLGQRILIQPGECAYQYGFHTKQRVSSQEAAFFLSLIDAFHTNSSSVGSLYQWIPQEIYNLDRKGWLELYWSDQLLRFLSTVPEISVNELGIVRIINNTLSRESVVPTVGVEQSGRSFYALYQTSLREEVIPLPCGHYTNVEELNTCLGNQMEFTQEQLSAMPYQCGSCREAYATVLTLVRYLNRLETPSCKPVGPSGLPLPCGCVFSDTDFLNNPDTFLRSRKCPKGHPVPIMELYYVKKLCESAGVQTDAQLPRLCMNCGHEERLAEWCLHPGCDYCTNCMNELAQMTSQGPAQCFVCCRAITSTDLPNSRQIQQDSAMTMQTQQEAPIDWGHCSMQCGRDAYVYLTECPERYCCECLKGIYYEGMQTGQWRIAVDEAAYRLMAVIFKAPPSVQYQKICQNSEHRDGVARPGMTLFIGKHAGCYPCLECLHSRKTKDVMYCPICLHPFDFKDKKLAMDCLATYSPPST